MIEKNLNERRQVEKKILPEYYKEIRTHRKMFEIRKDEDNFQVGDIIVLREWDGEKYTGNKTRREITYILRNAEGYGLKEGYCILSLQVPGWDHFRPRAVLDEEKTQLSEETSTNGLISRQAAIDAFLTELTKRERNNLLHTWSTVEVKYFVADMLEHLPSALPPAQMHDKHTETHGVCLDCISRQALIDEILEDGNGAVLSYPAGMCEDELVERIEKQMIEHFIGVIKYAPPVEPNRPKGEWIESYLNECCGTDENHNLVFRKTPCVKCDQCGEKRRNKEKFCPNCGADMRGDEDV